MHQAPCDAGPGDCLQQGSGREHVDTHQLGRGPAGGAHAIHHESGTRRPQLALERVVAGKKVDAEPALGQTR